MGVENVYNVNQAIRALSLVVKLFKTVFILVLPIFVKFVTTISFTRRAKILVKKDQIPFAFNMTLKITAQNVFQDINQTEVPV